MCLTQEMYNFTTKEINECKKGEIELGPPESIIVKREKLPR